MLGFLQRQYYKQEGGNKYQIDCNEVESNLDSLEINKVVRYKNDVSILSGLLTHIKNKTVGTKYPRHIVVKIGLCNKTLEKEFKIGNLLASIPGYISYICLFDCYDDSYEKINPSRICNAEKKDTNLKKVLLMPYIIEGSVKNYKWSLYKFDILRSVVIQAIMSTIQAYQKVGFIHGDFHLDNILLKKTKKKYITYNIETDKGIKEIQIPSNEYKVIIMDFENSWIIENRVDGIELFWSNIYNMISRLNWDLEDNNKNKVNFVNLSAIISYIEKQKQLKSNCNKANKIITMINESPIKLIKIPKTSFAYNPNVL